MTVAELIDLLGLADPADQVLLVHSGGAESEVHCVGRSPKLFGPYEHILFIEALDKYEQDGPCGDGDCLRHALETAIGRFDYRKETSA